MTAHHVTRYRVTGTPAAVRGQVARWSADPAVTRVVVDRLPDGRAAAAGKVRTVGAAADAVPYWPAPAPRAVPPIRPRAVAVAGGVAGVTVLAGVGYGIAVAGWPAALVILGATGAAVFARKEK